MQKSVLNIVSKGESETVEFKTSFNDDVIVSLTAFANTQGGVAYIVVGDKGIPRNKAIAEFFKNLGWIEKYGSGIGRIINYFKDAGLPSPSFQNHSNGFLVTVFAASQEKVGEKVLEKVGEKVREKLTENQIRIINCININKYLSAKDISFEIGISARKVEENISKLKKQGYIKRIGPAKGGYWQVINTKNNE